MKYVTLLSLLATTVSSMQTIDIAEINSKVGDNVNWANDRGCPNSLDPYSVVEYFIESTESNLSFENYKQACEEAFLNSPSAVDTTKCL